MSIDLSTCRFTGPALPAPFVRFELEKELKDLLPKATGDAGQELSAAWDAYRRHLRELVSQGGPIRVRNTVIEPLAKRLGYDSIEEGGEVATREGPENGGNLLLGVNCRLRVWTTELGDDLDAPSRRGHAYRFSPLKVAQRVLLASNERVGLLTNGVELRILISDPARTDSEIEIQVESDWKRSRTVPDSYRLVLALCSPAGLKALPELIEKARLRQTGVTKELRKQARQGVELFVQGLLSHPENRDILLEYPDKKKLADQLWHEGLINIFRLLFVLKMESIDDPARAFSFAASSLWRKTYSPTVALGPVVRAVADNSAETGRFLEDSLRALFRLFTDGLACTEMPVKPLGGALFGENAAPLIYRLHWGEHAVADLLDKLLWTPRTRGADSRERVHYGPLTVQDLGRVYESLIELEPGISIESMCRLRRNKLEVVVPLVQGEKYRSKPAYTAEPVDGGRAASSVAAADTQPEEGGLFVAADTKDEYQAEEPDDAEDATNAKKTKIEWMEEIPADRFYLRVGLGRKSSGSYYTPDSFVKFLVKETLGPLCEEKSPKANPRPARILDVKVADIAMGSGHFLFEACEFLGDKLYEACRLCDELAMQKEAKTEVPSQKPEVRNEALAHAAEFRSRVQALPDPNDELMAYLPSRAPEDGIVGFSAARAQALCKRLVAVHCLYGVDLNPLAVELAKLSLWIETHAEGLPLTFLNHRFVVGDSLTGPFFEHLLKYPGSQQSMDDLFTMGLKEKFTAALQSAMREVRELDASVGINLGEIEAKKAAKARMDQLLDPFKLVAAAWTGGVMMGGPDCDDQAYADLAQAVAEGVDVNVVLNFNPILQRMAEKGKKGVPFELIFPDVFFRDGNIAQSGGFDVVLGNPPWDTITIKTKEWLANFDFAILSAPTKRERDSVETQILTVPSVNDAFRIYFSGFEEFKRANDTLYVFQKVEIDGDLAGRFLDLFRVFMERNAQLIKNGGATGVVIPSAFHANAGAIGIRHLYLEKMSMRCCYSFENRRKLFDIDSRFKFALVIASKPGPTIDFPCAFYLHDDEWLFNDKRVNELNYSLSFVRATSTPFLSLVELTSTMDRGICDICYSQGEALGTVLDREGQSFSTAEINLNLDSSRLEKASDYGLDLAWLAKKDITFALQQQVLLLAEGKCLWHFDVLFAAAVRYVIPFSRLHGKTHWFKLARFYRVSYRKIASSTNERTFVWMILPAGLITSESCPSEQKPWTRANATALTRLAILNSYVADFLVRMKVATTVSMFILRTTPVPIINVAVQGSLTHMALRLQCQDEEYLSLWAEQLGDEWREPKPKHAWPVLEGDDERWAVRSAIDAVVAEAYGLTREQYAHVLSSFSHKSYPKAPELCLARFDELKAIGLEAFTKKHDPYWDIPLNESLPKPVIELPIPEESGYEGSESGKKRRSRKAQPGIVKEGPAEYGPLFNQSGNQS